MAPSSVLVTDWSIRTDDSSWTFLFHETVFVAIPGTSHVMSTALPTVRFLKDPVITISTAALCHQHKMMGGNTFKFSTV